MKKEIERLLASHGIPRDSGSCRDYEQAKALFSEIDCDYEYFIRVVVDYLKV